MAGDIKWIKVITDIFEDEKVKLIKSMPEGRTLVLLWFQLLIQAGKTNASGWIYLSEDCPYTPSMLATLFNESQQMVELALKLFSTKPFEMIEITDDGLIYIPNWEKHQNVESMDKIREKERLRKAKQREKQKMLKMSRDSHGTSHETSHQSHATEVELEVDIEKDTTTNAEIELQRVAKSYYDIHQHELKPRDWPEMTKAVKEYGADHIIAVMEAKSLAASGDVTTFRYYLSAIKEKSEDTMNRRRKGNKTYYTPPSELEAQQAMRMAGMQKDAEIRRHPPLSEVGEL